MKILSIDTSSSNCSIAVVGDEATLGEININYNLQHSVLLMPLVEELLNRLDLSPKDLTALTLSLGPGSFTGLRIGLAAVKGLASGLDLPIYAVDSIKTLAYGAYGYQGIIVPMVDALRGGYYTGIYTFEKGEIITLMDPIILTFEEIKEKLMDERREIMIMGDVVYKIPKEDLLFNDQVIIAPRHLHIPKASHLPDLLWQQILDGRAEDIHTLVPLYMRKSQAENEYEKKKGRLI